MLSALSGSMVISVAGPMVHARVWSNERKLKGKIESQM